MPPYRKAARNGSLFTLKHLYEEGAQQCDSRDRDPRCFNALDRCVQ